MLWTKPIPLSTSFDQVMRDFNAYTEKASTKRVFGEDDLDKAREEMAKLATLDNARFISVGEQVRYIMWGLSQERYLKNYPNANASQQCVAIIKGARDCGGNRTPASMAKELKKVIEANKETIPGYLTMYLQTKQRDCVEEREFTMVLIMLTKL